MLYSIVSLNSTVSCGTMPIAARSESCVTSLIFWPSLVTRSGLAPGRSTISGVSCNNAILMQLYVPLNFMGMVYREIKQGLIDIETMFALLHEPAEVLDRPGAKPLVVTKGE